MTDAELTWFAADELSVFQLFRYDLALRSPFGTAHGATTSRRNVLVSFRIHSVFGFAEIGLPPLKPLCYLADVASVLRFAARFHLALSALSSTAPLVDPLTSPTAAAFFPALPRLPQSPAADSMRRSLAVLHAMPLVESADRAARCGFEGALLDAWARVCRLPLSRLLVGGDSASLAASLHKPLYYTVSLNDNDAELLESARLGARTTCHLKIKADADLAKTLRVVPLVLAEARRLRAPRDDLRCVVDANASWAPDTAARFLDWFAANRAAVPLVALEQPFPLDCAALADAERERWRAVRRAALDAGVDVVADESCATAADVPLIAPLCTAVNIKLEKCGGILGALELVAAARAHGLKLWLGTMVGSTLNSNTVAQLLPLSDLGGDLDGTLLVRPESDWFTAGFQYGADGRAAWVAGDAGDAADASAGVGVSLKRRLVPER